MKKLKMCGMVLLCLLFGGALQTQNFNEWFRQKRTQRKYLLEQIIALEAFIDVSKKGYDIAREGLDVIGLARDGDWKQFIEYFGSLEAVNPLIARLKRLQDIVEYNKRIVSLYTIVYLPAKNEGRLNDAELRQSAVQFDAVLKSSVLNLREADDIITPGKLTMKDDERLRRIDYIFGAMAGNYSLAWHLFRQVLNATHERQLTLGELELIKKLQR